MEMKYSSEFQSHASAEGIDGGHQFVFDGFIAFLTGEKIGAKFFAILTFGRLTCSPEKIYK